MDVEQGEVTTLLRQMHNGQPDAGPSWFFVRVQETSPGYPEKIPPHTPRDQTELREATP